MAAMQMQPFQTVAERYARDVWRLCASQVGVQQADDCFQETMLAALEAYPRLRDPGAVRSWLLRIASRKAIDRHRSAAREPTPTPAFDLCAPDSEAARESELLELVRQLPHKQRLAIAHRFIADLPYREIAQLMGTSEAAARRNVHEGVKTLRIHAGAHARRRTTATRKEYSR
jgi:RNA polymerase sigma factor (sigma-70 family)